MKKLLIVLALLMTVMQAAAQSPRLPENFSTQLFTNLSSSPTAMAFAPDGRLFVLEQTGAVRVVTAAGTLLTAPFTTFAVNSNGERGLLGIAFDPDFVSNQYIYFYYTRDQNGKIRNQVVRVTADGDVALAGSQQILVKLPKLSSASNHNGGALHFGLDGKLYVAVGENANGPLAQSMTTRLGKMLRYNPDGSIPADNPFYATASGDNRAIWALGLRNPYTFAVQPGSGTIFINDVGQGSWEEINLGSAGANYGWPLHEGASGAPTYVEPIYAYGHTGSNCAISGGAFYNPSSPLYPDSFTGDYFFADFCQDEVRVRDVGGTVTVFDNATSGDSIVDLRVGPDGKLYYLSRNPAAVYRYEFETEPLAGEIVSNGSFETDSDSNGIPDGWSGTARVCGIPEATAGTCALRLKSGGASQQKIKVRRMVDGTALEVSAMVSGKNVPEGAVIRLKIQTSTGSATYTIPVPTGTYTAQEIGTLSPIFTEGQGIKIKLFLNYPVGGGKAFFDEVSIVATPAAR